MKRVLEVVRVVPFHEERREGKVGADCHCYGDHDGHSGTQGQELEPGPNRLPEEGPVWICLRVVP